MGILTWFLIVMEPRYYLILKINILMNTMRCLFEKAMKPIAIGIAMGFYILNYLYLVLCERE